MNIKAIASNPWVWVGGATLGVLVLLINSSKGAAGDTQASQWNPNQVRGLYDIQGVGNAAGSNYLENLATISAETAKARDANTLTEHMKIIDMIQNLDGVYTAANVSAQQSFAGIANAQIQQSTALALDRNQNAIRRDMIYVAGDTSTFQTQAALADSLNKTAAASAAADAQNATTAANNAAKNSNDFWGMIVNGITTVAKLFL